MRERAAAASGSPMKFLLIALGLLTVLAPVASAAEPVPVGSCVGFERCPGGTDACVGAFSWVPQCVDACDECVDLDLPPLVGVCVEGLTHSSCYRFKDVCVSVSEMVPQCVDVCNGCADAAVLAGPPLVSVCVEGRTDPSCYGFNTACVEISQMVPKCVDLDALAEAQPRCLDYYYDLEAGPVYYRQPNSCTRELYVNGDRVL